MLAILRIFFLGCLFFGILVENVSAKEDLSATQIQSPIRAFHFALRHLSLKEGLSLIDKLKGNHFNTIQVMLTTGVKFKFSPWTPDSNAWSSEDFKQWVEYAKKNGLEVIPELKLLTHQERHFFQNNYPNLMYEKDTYDPRKRQVYEKVFALLDEIINLVHPNAIHIGHDELVGWKKVTGVKAVFSKQVKILPADLFLQDVLKLHGYLASRGVKTWMWGDLFISEDEAPEMNNLYLHGGMPGYGAVLRHQLPKDIVICDWHYRDTGNDFESMKVFKREGFLVVGATWKNDKNISGFSRYAARHGAYGMMATSWYYLNAKKATLVDHIIRFSGKTFLKDFPDGK